MNDDILGVDCANVIFRPFSGRQISGSITCLQKIKQSNRFSKIFIISRAGIWNRFFFPFRLSTLNFWQNTGITKDSLYFCWRNKDKASLCKILKVTHFVDDRLDVLQHLQGVKHLYALNPSERELSRYPETAKNIIVTKSWDELTPLLLNR
jgi:hypothetical protein